MKNNKPELTIDKYGNKRWLLNGKYHRIDGPAVIYSSGTKEWWLNGKLHRIEGPAVIYFNGTKQWYLNGKLCTYEEWFNLLTLEQKMNYLWNLDET